MKHPIISSIGLAILSGASFLTPALASPGIDCVPVANISNAPPPAGGYGAVDHAYNIGNVWKWNDAAFDLLREVRGVDSDRYGVDILSTTRVPYDPSAKVDGVGFRVSRIRSIPETMSLFSTLVLVSGGLLVRRRG